MEENLTTGLNDRARKVKISGRSAIVPLKFDDKGNPADKENIILKKLSMDDLRFLKVWRECGWDVEAAFRKTEYPRERIERMVKRLSVFREEDARVKSIAEIPTASWIKAKHVENFYEGGTLEDSQHKSLQELAKIEGAYKNNLNVSVTQNVFNLPKLDPETEAKLKEIAKQEAEIIQSAQEAEVVSHG